VNVGLDNEQPFFIICGHCRTVIKGKQVIWYEPSPGGRLEMEAAKLIDSQGEDNFLQTISINPDFPARRLEPETDGLAFSSFLLNMQLLGPAAEEAMRRMGSFRHIASEQGAGLRRLGNFYLNRDWQRFREEGRRLFGENWQDTKEEWQCHHVLSYIFLQAYSPLLIGHLFPRFVEEWNLFISSNRERVQAQRVFVEALLTSGRVHDLQRLVLERFDFVATHNSALRAAIPAELYRDGVEMAIAELQLPRDDFDTLKGHYVDCYELAHHVLSIIVGTINVVERGSHDAFDAEICAMLAENGMGNFKNIPTLAAFDGRPNGPKRAFLKSLPVCEEMWNDFIERDLRNAVGHYGARHDLQTGMIVVDGKAHCSYLEFVVKAMRMAHVLLCLLHILKMCHMQMILTEPGFAERATKRPRMKRGRYR